MEKETVGVAYLYFEKSLYRFKPYNDRKLNANYSVKAHVYPATAEDQNIRYESSNMAVVSINEYTGYLSTGMPGNATITAYLVSNPNKKIICQVSVKYELDVWHYYDQGMQVRYDNADEGIETGQELVSEVFDEGLGLHITTKRLSQYNSPPDICKGTVTEENLNTMCSHNPCCSNAHTMYGIFHDSYDVTQNTQVSILWSGHRTEWGENVNRSFAVQDNDGSYTIMMLNNETTMALNGYILLHETAHAVGAPDHYHDLVYDPDYQQSVCKNKEICSDCGKENKRSSSCTMNRPQYYSGSKQNFFCAECREDIRQHLAGHH